MTKETGGPCRGEIVNSTPVPSTDAVVGLIVEHEGPATGRSDFVRLSPGARTYVLFRPDIAEWKGLVPRKVTV